MKTCVDKNNSNRFLIFPTQVDIEALKNYQAKVHELLRTTDGIIPRNPFNNQDKVISKQLRSNLEKNLESVISEVHSLAGELKESGLITLFEQEGVFQELEDAVRDEVALT